MSFDNQSWNKMRLKEIVLLVVLCMIKPVWGTPIRYEYCKWKVKDYDCPIFEDSYWDCLNYTASCPEGTKYHCARNYENKVEFMDGCAPAKTCFEGEAPYLKFDESTQQLRVHCDYCFKRDKFNSKQILSSNHSDCEEVKVRCDPYHGIECEPVKKTDVYTRDRLCRCDAKKGYIVRDLQRLGEEICSSDGYLVKECVKAEPCGNNQERLLNYTCVDKCVNGYRSAESDECIYVSPSNSTTEKTPEDTDSYATKGSRKPTTPSTTSSTSTSSTSSRETSSSSTSVTVIQTTPPQNTNHNTVVIVCVVLGFIIICLVVVIFVCWKSKTTPKVKANGDPAAEKLLLKKGYYECEICVTSEEYTDKIARAGINISQLDITQRLEAAIKAELSNIEAVKNVTVKTIRNGSLLVVFIIETEYLSSSDDLKACLKETLKRGRLGDFAVRPNKFKFDKYSDRAPLPRRPSVQDTTLINEEKPRRSLKRAHSLPVSDAEKKSMLGDSGNTAGYERQNIPSFQIDTVAEVHEEDADNSPRPVHEEDPDNSPRPVRFTLHKPLQSAKTNSQHTQNNGQIISPNGSCKSRMFRADGRSTKVEEFVKEEVIKETHSRTYTEDVRPRKDRLPVRMRRISSSSEHLSQFGSVENPVLSRKHLSEPNLDAEELDILAKKVLSGRYEELLYSLQPDAILDKFVKVGFMREIDIRDIREQPSTTEKNRMIINALMKRGYEGLKKFKEIYRTIHLDLATLDNDETFIAQDMKAHPEKYRKRDEQTNDKDDGVVAGPMKDDDGDDGNGENVDAAAADDDVYKENKTDDVST